MFSRVFLFDLKSDVLTGIVEPEQSGKLLPTGAQALFFYTGFKDNQREYKVVICREESRVI